MSERKIVYHYCSAETFEKILESKTLRFSDVEKSNDCNEIKYLWQKYYQYIDLTAQNRMAVPSLKYEIKKMLAQYIFLVICFSEEADSFHMWNSYAQQGVAIGFDYAKLQKWVGHICYSRPSALQDLAQEQETLPNQARCASIRKIEYYGKQKICQFIEKQCKDIEFVLDKMGLVFLETPFIKNNFFDMEKEVRAMICIDTHANWVSGRESWLKLEFNDCEDAKGREVNVQGNPNRHFANVLSVDIPFPTEMLKSVTIGPQCTLQNYDVKYLLDKNGFREAEILYSKGSYR